MQNMPRSAKGGAAQTLQQRNVYSSVYLRYLLIIHMFSTFPLLLPILTSFPQGNLSGQNGVFSADWSFPGDQIRSQVYPILIFSRTLLYPRVLTLTLFATLSQSVPLKVWEPVWTKTLGFQKHYLVMNAAVTISRKLLFPPQ